MSTELQNAKQSTVNQARRKTATIHLVQSSRLSRRIAVFLLFGLLLSFPAMALLPWQQTSRATGQVIALNPQERQQIVKSQSKGIIKKIAEGLVDGARVKKGELLLEIQPFAANKVEQIKGQISDLEFKEKTAEAQVKVYGRNIADLTEARKFGIEAAEELILAAKAKLSSKTEAIKGYQATVTQAQLNYDRQRELYGAGAKPGKEVEKLLKELEVAQAKLSSATQDVEAAKNEVNAKKDELEEKRLILTTKVDYAVAMQEDAKGKVATIRKEKRKLEAELDALNRLKIYAPRDGRVFRLAVNEQGDTVKEGDHLLTIIPDVTEIAVELFVIGNDMPLMQVGQEVRLQFEGWPAVQFSGWPSAAVGTFSGTVSMIDAADNGKGEFRILVIPNEQEQEWPSDRYLRQGVRVNGWVMLRRVSLGYEIWRQLNGFPVNVSPVEPSKEKAQTPKIPK